MRMFMKTVLVLSGLLLVGCGGGGASSPANKAGLEYKGKTTLALLDDETINEFIENANISFADLIVVPDTINESFSEKLSKIPKQSEKQTNGSNSGSVDYVEEDIDSVTKKITAIFKNFNDGDSETLDGKIVFLIAVDEEENFFIKKLDIELENFQIEDTGIDLILHGSMKMLSDDSGTRKTLTQNIVAKNNIDDTMLKLENFVTVVDNNGRGISYDGKIYDSERGYVEISTPAELDYDNQGNLELGGEILYEGENAIVKERTAHDNSIRLEIDYGKDGSVNDFEVYNAATLEVIPNREPVISISFPQSIYTDTDMSAVNVNIYDPDLDGFTSSYEWEINGTNQGSELALDNTLFKKHDMLKLIVTATDDRVGDVKSNTQTREQEVLNSAPVAMIESNTTMENIEALTKIEFDASPSTDKDGDILTYQWKVYKYIPEGEWNGETIVKTVWTDIAETVGDIDIPYVIIEVNASQYMNNLTLEKPIFNTIAEGKHIISCTVFDDDMAEHTAEFNLTIKPLDIIQGTESKVFFEGEDTLEESTFNDPIMAYDLNNNGEKELIYFTRDPQDTYKTLLHITSDAKKDSVTNSYDVNSTSIDIKDVNGDGLADIITGELNNQAVMLQNNQGTFEKPYKYYIWYKLMTIDDVNGDGKVDGVRLDGCTLEIYTNFDDYNEKIQHIVKGCNTENANNTLSINDFNNDGISDYMIFSHSTYDEKGQFVIVTKDSQNKLEEGNITFVNEGVFSQNISVGDINGDGFNDVIIDFVLFENNKDFTFQKIETLRTKKNGSTNDRIVIADINNDDKEDIVYHNADILRVLVQGDNYQMSDFKIKRAIDNIVISDIDNDGKVEIIENYQNRIEITSFK